MSIGRLDKDTAFLFDRETDDVRFTFNKAAAGDDVAVTFQTNYSARALFGLLGDDDFTIKVSPDGSNYFTGFVVDRSTGRLKLPLAPKFSAYTNFDNYVAANTWTKVQFNNADSNDQNAFNGSNNNFTAPFAGNYAFGFLLRFKANATAPTKVIAIARTYKHDSIPWCALTVNYTLIASGLPGNDSLWALDFARYGIRLKGAAVGAIATKTRDGGGHVFLVVGRTKDGRLVGRGGNQRDMVCDEVFDPSVITACTWPKEYPQPVQVGFATLPVVEPAQKARRDIVLPPPTKLELPAKGVVPPPKAAKEIITKGVPAGGAAGGVGFWDWVAAHPWATAGIAVVGVGAIGGAVYAESRPDCNLTKEQTMLMFGLVAATFVAVYWFWIRPVLKSRPAFRELYEREESFFAAVRQKFAGVKQKLSSAIVVAGPLSSITSTLA